MEEIGGRATAVLSFVTDGAQRFEAALDREVLKAIETASSALPSHKPGVRLRGNSALDPHLAVDGQVGAIARSILGSRAKPVRAIIFNKTPLMNWKLGWHQDRTIAVRGRADVAGYGPWSVKSGLQHVEPPFDLLAAMVTLRIHMDNVGPGNAPLLIAPGSHRFGRVRRAEIGDVVKVCGISICLAELGDVWLYARRPSFTLRTQRWS